MKSEESKLRHIWNEAWCVQLETRESFGRVFISHRLAPRLLRWSMFLAVVIALVVWTHETLGIEFISLFAFSLYLFFFAINELRDVELELDGDTLTVRRNPFGRKKTFEHVEDIYHYGRGCVVVTGGKQKQFALRLLYWGGKERADELVQNLWNPEPPPTLPLDLPPRYARWTDYFWSKPVSALNSILIVIGFVGFARSDPAVLTWLPNFVFMAIFIPALAKASFGKFRVTYRGLELYSDYRQAYIPVDGAKLDEFVVAQDPGGHAYISLVTRFGHPRTLAYGQPLHVVEAWHEYLVNILGIEGTKRSRWHTPARIGGALAGVSLGVFVFTLDAPVLFCMILACFSGLVSHRVFLSILTMLGRTAWSRHALG